MSALSQTALRKAAVGTTVCLTQAPYVRFTRSDGGVWTEVPRMGITPRSYTTSELFSLPGGVSLISA